MKKNKYFQFLNNYKYIFIPYFILGGILISYLQFYIDGIDMLNYISVAEKYAKGYFYDAINDYWSPMIPWLLIPFIFTKLDPFLSFHILQLLIGLFTIKICIDFLQPIQIKQWIKYTVYSSLIPLVLCYGQLYGSPDLLFLTVLLYYLKSICNENYFRNSKYGFATGALAGVLFLVKAYGFPFICVHFTVVNGLYWFKNRQNKSAKIIIHNFLRGVSLFLLIAGIWIATMSIKNKAFTISGSGKYNFSLIGPEYMFRPECYLCHPAYEQGLFNPPNATAINSTESPALFKIHTWSPFASESNVKHWLRVIQTNIESIYYLDFKRQIGTVLFITLLFFLITSGNLKALPLKALVLFVSVIIYNLGYIFVIVNHRYIWMNTIIFIILFCYLIEQLPLNNKRVRLTSFVLSFFFLLFLIKRPVKELLLLKDRDTSIQELRQIVLHPFNTIEKSIEPHKNLFHTIDELKNRKELVGKIANRQQKKRENYMTTAVICYYAGSKHYGELTNRIIEREGYQQLNDFNIDYYYSWNDNLKVDSVLMWPPVYSDSVTGLQIYKVLKKGEE